MRKYAFFLRQTFSYMACGVALTGAVAMLIASHPALMRFFYAGPLGILFQIAPIALVFGLSFSLARIKAGTAQMLFWLYSGLMGICLSGLFYRFTGESLGACFLIASSVFGTASAYGYLTNNDLAAWRSWLVIGAISLMIASFINVLIGSSEFQMLLSLGSVVIFTGFTAYDIQNIKQFYTQKMPEEMKEKASIFGALQLYLNFINIFISLLRLFGDREKR